MQRLAILLIFLVICQVDYAQMRPPIKRNDVYVEALGAGLFGSLNYEYQLSKMPGLGIRVGVGFYTENKFYLTIPIGLHYIFPLNRVGSFVDAGFAYSSAVGDGRVFADKEQRDKFNSIVPSIGYRKHTPHNFMWRASFTPVINYSGFHPSIGISFGKRF